MLSEQQEAAEIQRCIDAGATPKMARVMRVIGYENFVRLWAEANARAAVLPDAPTSGHPPQ